MASDENDDTLTGLKTRWDATSALTAAAPNGLRSGRMIAPEETPWAHMSCKQGIEKNNGPAPQIQGATYHDFRLVTFSVWGDRGSVVTALNAISTAFDEQPKGASPLTIPNAVRLVRMQRLFEFDSLEPDGPKRGAEDVYKGVRAYQVWTLRTIP